ncbi:MAG TPA: type II toxin-antitoxin system RelE/ParE family toxin [Dermatophilaceae bacterium]|jgi:mRNA interferase RelE/StbE
MARVVLTDDAKDDLRNLDGAARKLLAKKLKQLEDEPEKRGAPLGSRSSSNLTTFRKLVVGDRDYRIVYRVEPDGTVCVDWVIGRRSDNEVHQMALARLKMLARDDLTADLTGLLKRVFDKQGE